MLMPRLFVNLIERKSWSEQWKNLFQVKNRDIMEGKGGEKSIKHLNYFPQHEFIPHA